MTSPRFARNALTTVTPDGSFPTKALPGASGFAPTGVAAVRASASNPSTHQDLSPASDSRGVMETTRHRNSPRKWIGLATTRRQVLALAYVAIALREIDRGLDDDTVRVFIAFVYIVGAVLLWGRWTDAFWMWR